MDAFLLRASIVVAGLLMTEVPAAARVAEVTVLDDRHIRVLVQEGEVHFTDDASGDTAYQSLSYDRNLHRVERFGTLDTAAAALVGHWRIRSVSDASFAAGRTPRAVHRKSKINGMAQKEWVDRDFTYDTTMEHVLYLELDQPLRAGNDYEISIDAAVGCDRQTQTLSVAWTSSRSEAIHVNLNGYEAGPGIKSADLYHWMGSGGACDVSRHAGKDVQLYDLDTGTSTVVGTVSLWKQDGKDVWKHPMIRCDVYAADLSACEKPGRYRLVIDGVGCSADFEIGPRRYRDPFLVSTRGFFYMRIGQDRMDLVPIPRRPLYIPGRDPAGFTVVKTTMHPYRPEWQGGGDRWDQPDFFARFVQDGRPGNAQAWGGHSDAADWDRHLGHVSIIYDLLLPYLLCPGHLDDDDLGIAESGNRIPDVIDEARYEVDFWLRLRDGEGYSHGLTNAKDNVMYQAGATPIAAWANAANAAMLAQAFQVAERVDLMATYRDEAIQAYRHAAAQEAHWLDALHGVGNTTYRGRDLKFLAAACLFEVTGAAEWEDAVLQESVVDSPTARVDDGKAFNQLYGTAFYIRSRHPVRDQERRELMRAALIQHAVQMERAHSQQRPSRRSTDDEVAYFHTIHDVQRCIVAHAVAPIPWSRRPSATPWSWRQIGGWAAIP